MAFNQPVPHLYLSPPLISHAPDGARQLLNQGMIATGNHYIERFAALCNTPGGSQERCAEFNRPAANAGHTP